MINKKIKFSHEYAKMPTSVRIRRTYLLGIQKTNYKELPLEFITYDTLYEDIGEDGGLQYYMLPKGELIILTLFI